MAAGAAAGAGARVTSQYIPAALTLALSSAQNINAKHQRLLIIQQPAVATSPSARTYGHRAVPRGAGILAVTRDDAARQQHQAG
jgi:hypothetical protein